MNHVWSVNGSEVFIEPEITPRGTPISVRRPSRCRVGSLEESIPEEDTVRMCAG